MSDTPLTLSTLRAHLRKLCEQATPAPWEAMPRHCNNDGAQDEMGGLGWDVEGPVEPDLRGMFSKAADAKLIAAARTAIPALLDALDQAEAEVARLRKVARGEAKTP